MTCEHGDFEANVWIDRLADPGKAVVTGFMAHLTFKCKGCGAPMVFPGLPVGLSMIGGATTNVDATEVRLAMVPQGTAPTAADVAQAVGFRVRGGVPS